MPCVEISHSKRRAKKHFYLRFKLRKIDELISLDELERSIKQYYIQGSFVEDKKHLGIEGPRYRIFIKKNDKLIIIIIEKTKDCLLPITVWFKSLR